MHVPPQPPSAVPCRLAFLGEAPGEDEVSRGGFYLAQARRTWPDLPWTFNAYEDARISARLPALPLVGDSGRVFNAILRAANIAREACWVGNVFDEKAPDNDVGPWMRDEERAGKALSRLASELSAAQPTVIVPMGATALWALAERSDISRARGSVTSASRVVPGAKLVPTLHPAYVQRVWKAMPLVIGDLIKAEHEAQRGPSVIYPNVKLHLEPTLYDLFHWKAKLLNSELLSIDIETGWGQITCVGFAPDASEALVVPFFDLRRPNRSYWDTEAEELTAWQWVRDVLSSPTPKLGQNYGGYDAFWFLERMGMRTMNLLHDTRLIHHAKYPELPKDLASLAGAYSDMPGWKHWSGHKTEKRDE